MLKSFEMIECCGSAVKSVNTRLCVRGLEAFGGIVEGQIMTLWALNRMVIRHCVRSCLLVYYDVCQEQTTCEKGSKDRQHIWSNCW